MYDVCSACSRVVVRVCRMLGRNVCHVGHVGHVGNVGHVEILNMNTGGFELARKPAANYISGF